jgi:hypothetical protein
MTTIKENRSDGIEHQINLDGKENPKYIDLLDVDKPIAGQNFVCLSFISPEKTLKQKEIFFFENFLKSWDFKKSMEKHTQFLNFISYKYHINFEKLTDDFQSFIKEEHENLTKESSIEDEYKNFLDKEEENLQEKFDNLYNFQTSTRGIKVRGAFPSQQEAQLRCKLLRELDPNHDIYVGPIGTWVPFHPESYKTGKVEYLEDELNQLMHEKQKNEDKAKIEFDKRVKETKIKAMEENKQKAKESGNVLTQTINENGDLINVKNMNTQETNLVENGEVSTADIRQELFEGENVVLSKNTDHGLSELNNVTFSLDDNVENSVGDDVKNEGENDTKTMKEENKK